MILDIMDEIRLCNHHELFNSVRLLYKRSCALLIIIMQDIPNKYVCLGSIFALKIYIIDYFIVLFSGSIMAVEHLDHEISDEHELTIRATDMRTGFFADVVVHINVEVSNVASFFQTVKDQVG